MTREERIARVQATIKRMAEVYSCDMLLRIALNDVLISRDLEDPLNNEIFRYTAAETATIMMIDEDSLAQVAVRSDYPSVRLLAVSKISDQEILTAIVQCSTRDANKAVCMEALTKISDQGLLTDVATMAERSDVRLAAVEKIDDQDLLSRVVASNRNYKTVKLAALARIHDDDVLFSILEHGNNNLEKAVQMQIVSRLDSQELLGKAAHQYLSYGVAKMAIDEISDPKILQRIADMSYNSIVALHAQGRLDAVQNPSHTVELPLN